MTAVIWHDADRAASERLAMRIVLPLGRRRRGIWLAARALGDREARWVPVERAQLLDAVAQLHEWAENALPADREAAHRRVDRLAEALLAPDVDTVARACAALATVLLREQLGLSAPAAFVSELVGAGLLDAALDVYLARLDDVVRVFNAARDELLARDIDPQVRALGEDHLPLHLSCRVDRARLRLAHERRGRTTSPSPPAAAAGVPVPPRPRRAVAGRARGHHGLEPRHHPAGPARPVRERLDRRPQQRRSTGSCSTRSPSACSSGRRFRRTCLRGSWVTQDIREASSSPT